jgi:hypothetical protein
MIHIIGEALNYECNFYQKKLYFQINSFTTYGRSSRNLKLSSRIREQATIEKISRDHNRNDNNVQTCNVCGNVFKSEKYLLNHVRKVHRI